MQSHSQLYIKFLASQPEIGVTMFLTKEKKKKKAPLKFLGIVGCQHYKETRELGQTEEQTDRHLQLTWEHTN